MYMPMIPAKAATRTMVDAFRGYNHNLRIGDGEFYAMENMASDHYPVLAPRKKRGLYAALPNLTGIISKEKLCMADGTEFVIGENRYEMGLSDEPKTLTSMGAYVIILPDKKYINTIYPEDRGDIEARVVTSGTVTAQLCSLTGDVYAGAVTADTAPASPEDGDLWIDTGSNPHSLKRYSAATSAWVSIASTYVRIGAAGIGTGFHKGDGVSISGMAEESLNGTFGIWEKGDDFLVVTGILDAAAEQTAAVTVERTMPVMDFLLESENRLWGCRYGLNAKGEVVNEIYASKLGDFRNWNCYMGISTDSYTVSCGSDGAFTGAIAHMGSPLFFKENCFHKVYGSIPANFQVQTTACRGVQRGSHKSMAVVNEVLYYKAPGAVCAYDGSLPVEVSYCLGQERYSDAVGGGHGSKYYISMMDAEGQWHLFVWDTAKRLWHREDDLQVAAFCSHGGEMYAVQQGGTVLTLIKGDGTGDPAFHWMVETGEIGLESPDMKYISQMIVRLKLEVGTEVRFFARYNFSEEWEPLYALRSTELRSYNIPIKPKRCDYMKLRIEGDGPGEVYSITKKMIQGSGVS